MEEKERSTTNRNGWDIAGVDSMVREKRDLCKELRLREKIVQRQEEETRIRSARYNKMYANICEDGKIAKYLEQASLRKIEKGKGIRVLIRLTWRKEINTG